MEPMILLHSMRTYWIDSGDLVAIANGASFYILKYNGDVVSIHLDSGRPVEEQDIEDAFELLYKINECVWTEIWVVYCFIYNSSSWRLDYCVVSEVCTLMSYILVIITLEIQILHIFMKVR